MKKGVQPDNFLPVKILALASAVVFALFLWQGNAGFSLWDEGFLWYGVQRVLLGDVPVRDFMAYDPGRYYWSAGLASILGDNGIMTVRAAAAIFQALGLFTGALLIAQADENTNNDKRIFLIVSVATLAIWMIPRHKLFDISVSIFLIGSLTFLVRNPTPRRYFVAGTVVGLAAVFGRNHGVYGVVGSLGTMAYLSINRNCSPNFPRGFALWGAGIVLGFLPILLMGLIIPGFSNAFWESVHFPFEQQTTNLPLPVPWPWKANFATGSVGEAARGVLVGLFFIAALAFGGVAAFWAVIQRLRGKSVPPALVAAAFLAIPYAHLAFSRADVWHLAQGIFPLLVGCLVILSTADRKFKWSLAIALFVATYWVTHMLQPGWQCLASNQCVNVKISRTTLRVDPRTSKDIALLRELADKYAKDGRSFIATPFWPGAYALLERRSPMWEIYALWPRSKGFEKAEIERIKEAAPGFAIVLDLPLDGREELRFRNTHPQIYQYILDNFDPVPDALGPAYQIYKARSKGDEKGSDRSVQLHSVERIF